MKATASVALAAALLVGACGGTTPTPQPTIPTTIGAPSAPPIATASPAPTGSHVPISTISPTATVARTATVAPTATAMPSATATATRSLPPAADTPGVCAEADLIWDPTLSELLLVSCTTYSGGPTHLTVWGWNGTAWHVVTSGPAPARVVGGAALDTARNVLVVYGGYVPEVDPCSTETWEWDRTNWTHIDAVPPPACDHMKMIYVASTQQTLLMGGQDNDFKPIDETWSWDGSTWQQVDAELPPSRAHFGLAYDPAHEQVLLYGGLTTTAVLDDFWSWHAGAWQQIDFSGPGNRSHLGMAYDTAANELLLFGGATSNDSFGSLTNDTWLLTDGAWQQLQPTTSPPARGSASLGYDPERDLVVLYGGFDGSGNELADTWLWDGQTWECAAGCS